jgi:UDP-2,3-diacylglucosamine pyrophosphatase LpxH
MEERIPEGQKIYFLSDAHLGLPPQEKSLAREKLLVQWLNEVSSDAKAIYLLGDIFDYWFEYKKVVPKGFTRFLGKISELCDAGIEINIFTGNHDVWMFDYLPQETGVNVFRQAIKRNFNGKIFYMAHGDGLGRVKDPIKSLKKYLQAKYFSGCMPAFTLTQQLVSPISGLDAVVFRKEIMYPSWVKKKNISLAIPKKFWKRNILIILFTGTGMSQLTLKLANLRE